MHSSLHYIAVKSAYIINHWTLPAKRRQPRDTEPPSERLYEKLQARKPLDDPDFRRLFHAPAKTAFATSSSYGLRYDLKPSEIRTKFHRLSDEIKLLDGSTVLSAIMSSTDVLAGLEPGWRKPGVT